MTAAELEQLSEAASRFGLTISIPQQQALMDYLLRLQATSAHTNLTGYKSVSQMLRYLLLDSLAAALVWNSESVESVIDVGSGAGIPGLPLAIVYPQHRFTLVDSRSKKVDFVQEVATAMDLHNVRVLLGRAEELAHEAQLREHFDVALSKGLASLATLVELTVPFLRPGGTLLAWKGSSYQEEIESAHKALQELGAVVQRVVEYSLGDETRFLVVVSRVAPLQARYPRRVGIPQKRPL